MDKSESITELAKALSSFQGKMIAVKKDAINPFFRAKYATLDTIWETIRKPLAENGLSVVQTMGILPSTPIVALLETTLCHTSGEWISGTQLVNPVKDDPQSLGSASSYARRYSLSAILGLVADEDDDGNVATSPKVDHKPETTPKKSPAPIVKTPESQKEAPQKESGGKEIEFDASPIKNLGELWTRCKNYKIPRLEGMKLLGITEQTEIGDLNEAWSTIFQKRFIDKED